MVTIERLNTAARDLASGPLRRHGLFISALAGGAVLRLLALFGFPGVLWFTGDSYFYLEYARHLRPSPSKTLGYSFVLRLLEPLHSFVVVAVLQHLMGLTVAVLVYVLLRRAGLPAWAGTLLTLPMLYDAYQIELEHLLMSESLFTLLITVAVAMLLWRPRPSWQVAAGAGLLLGYAVVVRSAGAGVVPVLLGCLIVRRAGWKACTAIAAASALPLAGYAMWFHAARGTYSLTTSEGLFLWGRTASFANCAKMKPPPDELKFCPPPGARRLAPGTVIWRKVAPPRRLHPTAVYPPNNALLRDFAIRAIIASPRGYLRAVTRGTLKAFGTRRLPYPNADTEKLYHFPAKPHDFPGPKGQLGLLSALDYARTTTPPSYVSEPYAGLLRSYQKAVFLPGPVLALIFLLGAWGFVVRRRTDVLLAWAAAAALLLFPIATADFDYRYVLPVVPFACLAAGLAWVRGTRTAPPEDLQRDRSGLSRWSGIRGSVRRGWDRASAR